MVLLSSNVNGIVVFMWDMLSMNVNLVFAVSVVTSEVFRLIVRHFLTV